MPTVIAGTGHYVPERVVTNEELAPLLGTTADWIEERTGIRERRYLGARESASTMGEHAARAALENAGCSSQSIDAIIFATLSPDVTFPGSGVFLQRKLGLAPIPALDVRNQCSGFLYALSVANAWLATHTYERVLVVGSEAHSPGLDLSPEGRSVSLLFGDGAGAAVLEWRDDGDAGVIEVSLGADGKGAEALWCEAPGSTSRPHISSDDLEDGRHFPHMKGRTVFRDAVRTLEREITALFDRHGVGEHDAATALDDILLVPHQANRRINEMVAKNLGLRDDQVVHTIDQFGNTTAASLPMALDIARRDGRARSGQMVAMAAFGSGYTWGTALLRL
ncbi:ketoacyl-ACP synthase III [Persicimonas caeni]|uniref:Ketoacyl-ACP synthase III n=1 Tax=Persicimonas caeni TaxID=2292766 RepID=A0A4Y6PWB0_PERCE|nr:ketoacyl-ACP synthase III [Persicimonas caeni]QDG52622.1 ketoacyl-ACP synthase III [Persicimonas caeni]QED33844.1 ketoacyl-ACP synthase III [Persicimonas caeni]